MFLWPRGRLSPDYMQIISEDWQVQNNPPKLPWVGKQSLSSILLWRCCLIEMFDDLLITRHIFCIAELHLIDIIQSEDLEGTGDSTIIQVEVWELVTLYTLPLALCLVSLHSFIIITLYLVPHHCHNIPTWK